MEITICFQNKFLCGRHSGTKASSLRSPTFASSEQESLQILKLQYCIVLQYCYYLLRI